MLAVDIKKLSKTFGRGHSRVQAVDGIDLDVKSGEIFGLVGPDGAGKTTTIRMVCTVIKPDAEQVHVLGHDVVRETALIRRKIGYLSQRFSLYGDLTISENIDFFAEIHGFRHYNDRKQELLEFMRLDTFRNRLAAQLSGGMKQKLALACTLIHTPEIIFLDEPTTGVDPVSRRDFWWILSRLQKDGLTIVVSTPYLDEAERCHRMAMMNKGRIIMHDTPQAIKATLSQQLLEISCNRVRAARNMLLELDAIIDVQSFGDRLHVQAATDTSPDELVNYLKNKNFEIYDSRLVRPSLEDAFIHQLQTDDARSKPEVRSI